LTNAEISNINSAKWDADYSYYDDGNISSMNDDGSVTEFGYGDSNDCDLMTWIGHDSLDYDYNGQLTESVTASLVYNWDGKLRSAETDSSSISLKYDPMGNRVLKNSSANGNRKYIVDIVGKLPVVLAEIDTSDGSLEKSYYYASPQVIARIDSSGNKYFYLHDRLGSVRMVVGSNGKPENTYTYNPFGKDFATEVNENIDNPFKFTGQWYDSEIAQYYLRARMYDPQLMRFSSRDPVKGKQQLPMTLHKYIYCLNNPINDTDPSGELGGFAARATSAVVTGYALYGHGIGLATYAVASGDFRFFDLADVTFKVMPAASGLALLNPYGPVTNIVTGVFENLAGIAYGPVTGMTQWQALAVDVAAYALYYGAMNYAHEHIGTNINDMENYVEWMGVDWMVD